MKPETLAKLRAWVGLRGMSCWSLVRDAWLLEGVRLPDDYFGGALPMMRIVEPAKEPVLPGDIVVIRNHAFATNHCGIMLSERDFIHALEDFGVLLSRTDRQPWEKRIVGFLRLKSEDREA